MANGGVGGVPTPSLGRSGHSDLGETEARLRRALNLEGMVGMDWSGLLSPGITIFDATLPGFGNQRLRSFRQPATFSTTGGAGAQIGMFAREDVIIDRIMTFAPAACTGYILFQGPADADTTGPYNTTDSYYIDRAQSAEPGPLARNVGETAVGALIIGGTLAGATYPGTPFEISTMPFCLAAGSRLHFGSSLSRYWMISGRLF